MEPLSLSPRFARREHYSIFYKQFLILIQSSVDNLFWDMVAFACAVIFLRPLWQFFHFFLNLIDKLLYLIDNRE